MKNATKFYSTKLIEKTNHTPTVTNEPIL